MRGRECAARRKVRRARARRDRHRMPAGPQSLAHDRPRHEHIPRPRRGPRFAGDLVAGRGTVVTAPPEGDLLDYLAALRRLLALDLRRILPAHGPAIERPHELLEEYRHHRDEREHQVLAGLAAGKETVAGLVAAIYADEDPELHPVAALSVTAHLQKLEREGRVRRVPGASGEDAWHLAE